MNQIIKRCSEEPQFFFKILLILFMQTILQDFVNYSGNICSVTPETTSAFLETTRKYYQDITDPQGLGFALYKMAEQIMRMKAVPQGTLQFFEQCVYDIIDQTVKSEFRLGTEALRYVFDVNMQFYKHNNLDPTLKYPLGMNRKLNYYEPEVGEEIDVVKPYITSTSYCGWTRGVLISKDKKYTVLYANSESNNVCKDMPFFDKLGSRTEDYQWRMNLNISDKIDALNRVWFPSTITEIGVENGSKRARVSYRRFCEEGNKVDTDGNRYIGLGPNEDEWIDLLSCRIQRPNKMARQYCEYSHTSEEILIDDYYDLIFEKQNEAQTIQAIMRCNFTRSVSFLHFYERFAQLKGNQLFLQILRKRQLNIDNYINVMIVLGNTSFLIPRMNVKRFLPIHLEEGITYLKQNCKNFNNLRLDAISYFIESCCRRLYSLTRKHMILNEIKRFMCLQYLKLNLEKQMIALKYILELIRPLRPYQPSERQQLNTFLNDNQIFYKIIQANAHEQILSRSAQIIRYMVEVNIIGWPQIEHIWNIFPHSDLRSRTTIERLIGDISKDFTFEYTSKIIDKILTLKETDITIDKLNLLRTLKDKELNKEYKVKILNYLWECLTIKSTNIKQNVEEEIENVFRGFISTIKQNTLKLEVLKAIIQRLREINTVRTQMYLFKEFILTYHTKNEVVEQGGENCPRSVTDVVNYLKNEHIYDIILRLLGQNKAKDKIESMLEFLQFLFERDNDDISETVKAIYDILGPSDVFLLWAKNITKRAIHFFINMYQNTEDMSKFQKISTQGLEAIKTILLDINVSAGNMKVVTKRKVLQQIQGPLLPGATSVATSTEQYSLMRDKTTHKPKDEIITFIYILKSPFQCIGLSFLLRFLQVINSNSVYNDIVKLIIQFIENIDQSISHKTEEFRKQFLSDMFVKINELANKTQLDPSTKAQLDIYVNLIQELFAQTQKSGLQSIKPHFSTIQGENIRLRIENIMSGNQLYKKEPYVVEINENATIWDLKVKLSPIYSEPADKIDIIKYVNPIEETSFSRSLSDLHFFNEQGIKISRRDPKDIPRHDLVSNDGTSLNTKFEKIVQKWFSEYKNQEQQLGFEQLKKLGSEKWKGSIMKDQAKLEEVIAKYDKEHKKGINLVQFKDFFWRKSIENSTLVWRLINLSGHLNNLSHKNDPLPTIEITSLPRKILSTRVVYDTLFKILANPAFQPVHISYYKLLTMLETDHELCLVVKSNIREFLETEKCLYRLSYGLQSLTNELENNLQFYGEFFEHDGHQQIANKLQTFFQEDKSLYTFDTSLKTIVIPNLLRILNLYIYPWYSHQRMARFYKKIKINHFDLNDIMQKLQKQEYFLEENMEKRQILESKRKEINSEQIYRLSFSILQNLTKNFTNQYLVKICNETIRLLAYLSCAKGLFLPQTILNCANSGSLNIRRASHSLLYIYLLQHPQERFALLEKMVSNIPPQTKLSTNSYFEILKVAVEKSIQFSPDSQETTEYFTNLSLQLIKLFFSSPSEPRSTFSVSKNIEGILSNLLVIIQKKTNICRFLKHFKEELILKGLFFYKAKEKLSSVEITPEMLLSQYQPQIFENYPKCKSDVTRKILMEVIYSLYKESDGQRDYFFSEYILPILSQLPDNTKKAFPKSLHVGLNNLGSTCYMNSMLQVLNSIGVFRNALMMTNIDAPMVHQLKSLFSFLFFSERLDYIPKGLLNSFTPPINPGIQQDTTEFLNFLFDQLEHLLRQSPYKNLLEELFQGSQVAQMICHSCGAKRERIETFFSYSVQIEGKYDLQTALDGMHAGELISDCLCESCGNRSDTTKRNVLNEVPNIFFVHLKRIVFDYNMFMNTKIHTRLVFPEQLNFQPFTKEGLQLRESLGIQYMKSLGDNEEEQKKFQQLTLHGKSKDYYKLKLKGIIVHSGTADVGHYYTILKKDTSWVKFDDSRVTNFSQLLFDEECYGGAWVADQWGGSASSKNAYVLIYEKQFKKDIQIEQIKEVGVVEKKNVPQKEFKTFNTIDWYREVWLDNHLLMLEQHLTGQNFTKEFMSFIGKMLEISPSEATVSIISQIFYKISALSGQVGNLLEIFLKNQHLINSSILDNYVLLDSKRTFGMLFHQQQKVREFASVYLQRVLMICYEKEGDQAKEKVVRFIQEYINNLQGEVAKNWLRIDGYFRFFEKVLEASLAFPQLYAMFVSFDLVAYFIDFILEKQSPLNIYAKKYSLGTKSNPVNFSSGIGIILFLVKHSYGLIGKNNQIPSIREDRLFHLSDNAILCLCNMPFYEKMIKENQNPQALSALIQRISILNLAFSHSIARVMLKIFNQNTDVSDQCNTVLLCISRFMIITDDYWVNRAEFVLGYPSSYVYQKNTMNSIDEEKYTFPSTLENIFPLESLISYAYMNKLRVPLTVLNMIITILQATSCSPEAMDYIIRIPAPTYTYLRYIDWMRSFTNEVINHLNLQEKKKQEVIHKISLCNLYLDDLYKRINNLNLQMQVEILGKVEQKIMIDSYNDPNNWVQVNLYRVPVHGLLSLPSDKGNLAFGQILTNGRLETLVTEDSNILKFFKQLTKPLAIKAKNVEEHEDKDIISLFDEDPYPKQQNNEVKKEEGTEQQTKNESKMVEQSKNLQKAPVSTQPLEAIEEIVPVQANVSEAKLLEEYLYCIQVINNTDVNKIVVINYQHFDNAMIPHCLRIMSSRNKEQYWFHKINPNFPLGKADCTFVVEDYVPITRPFFRLYGNVFQQSQPVPQPEIPKNSEQKMDIEPTKDFNAQDMQAQDFMNDDQINCPHCTLFNPSTNTECQICGGSLR